MTFFLRTFCLSLLLISCGRGESKNNDAFYRQEEQAPEPDALQSLYRGDFRPVNRSSAGELEGQVAIRLIGDDFEANVAVTGVSESVHPQRIMTGERCPTESADTNGDGIISFEEAQVVSGRSFIPLDDDIDNVALDGEFPRGNFTRAYVYNEETSRSSLQSSLGLDIEFDLDNRVVMIYGTNEDEALPIGCAELYQVIGVE